MTGNGHNTQEELASYAMQSLPLEESASIRAHLQSCAPCRAELAEVSGDLALLGIAVEQHPLPEGARDRFLKRIAASPAVKPQETAREVTPISVKSRARTGLLDSLGGGRRHGHRSRVSGRAKQGIERRIAGSSPTW